MSDVTIYHNPRCSKSRNALTALNDAHLSPTIIKYLDDTPDKETLHSLIESAGISVRDAVRTGEKDYKELDLAGATDEQLLDAMVTHPKLIQRPIIVTPNLARIARDEDTVNEVLKDLGVR